MFPIVSIRRLPLAASALTLTIALMGCRKDSTEPPADRSPSGRLPVAASIFPIADALKQIGGDRVEVLTLLPVGQTPHGYEPTPAQAEALARTRLLVVVGLGLDDWARRSAAAAARKDQTVLIVGPKVMQSAASHAAAKPDEHGHDEDSKHDDHGHAGTDPHIWVDPMVMIRITDAITDTLCGLDPAGTDTYTANAQKFRNELVQLDRLYATSLKAVARKDFVTLHAAFGLMADRYGLKQLALRHSHAEETGPGHLEEVVAFIKKHKVKVIFAEPQFPAERLESLARETGASVGRLDPIGAPGVPGHDGYIALMKTNLDALVAGLSK